MNKRLPFSLRISIWTLIIWLILWNLNAGGWVFFCYGLMFLHELAHVLAVLFYGGAVESVTVYPFGLCACVRKLERLSHFERFAVYLAGPGVHVLMQILLEILFDSGVISLVMHDYLKQINCNYLFFNLLPIYPLDGYHLAEACLEALHPFLPHMMHAVSFGTLFAFVLFSPHRNAVLIVSALILFAINAAFEVNMWSVKKEKEILDAMKKYI